MRRILRGIERNHFLKIRDRLREMAKEKMRVAGRLAASVLAYVWERHGVTRPKLIIVEPERAACLLASARAGHATTVGGDLETIMAGLSCGEPSSLAWRILQPGADAFAAIPDSSAIEAMRTLADLGYAVGESGVASLAGFLSIIEIPICRELLHLDTSSRVLVYGTEGATDPDLYRDLVGRHAGDVEPAA